MSLDLQVDLVCFFSPYCHKNEKNISKIHKDYKLYAEREKFKLCNIILGLYDLRKSRVYEGVLCLKDIIT